MIYYGHNDYRDYLAHHGILGQRWGKRNGPPYPLGYGDHSASEKRAGWRDSLNKNKHKSDIDPVLNLRYKSRIYTREEDMSAVNPDYPARGTYNNCMNCTFAYEMRRRGYDVQAKKRDRSMSIWRYCEYFDGNVEMDSIDSKPFHGPYTQKGWNEFYKENKRLARDFKNDRLAKTAIEYFKNLPDNCRGTVLISIDENGGHGVVFEKIDGNGMILDCQSNTKYTVDQFAKYTLPGCWGAMFVRMDNAKINSKRVHDGVV